MKIPHLLAAIVLYSMSLLSCQKEMKEIIANGNRPDSTISSLISKEVNTYLPTNLDWLIKNYTYDSANRIAGIISIWKNQHSDGSITTQKITAQFLRDAVGRIDRISSVIDTLSMNTVIHYESPASPKALNICSYKTGIGMPSVLQDSCVLEYNGNNLISKASWYYQQSSGNLLKLIVYQQYLYDAMGNMTEQKIFQDNDSSGNFKAVLTYNWEFSEKNNPQYFNEPAYFYYTSAGGFFPYTCSPHVITRQYNYYYNGGVDDQINFILAYDSTSRLISRTKVNDADNVDKFYY